MLALAAAIGVLGSSACIDAESTAESTEACLVVDADALQDGVDGFPGAVFRVRLDSGDVDTFAADPRFRDPQDIEPLGDGRYLLVDFEAKEGDGRGAVFVLDADGAIAAAHTHPRMRAPTAIAVVDPRRAYITDRATRLDDSPGQGALFVLDPSAGDWSVAGDDRFRAPADVVVLPDGDLLVLDADARRPGSPGEEGALFRVDPNTREVTDVVWLRGTISPLGVVPEPDGTLLVLDVNADPHRVGGPLGAVFRCSLGSRETTLVASVIAFRDPVAGALRDDGSLLLVDANADPHKRGPDAVGRGQNLTGGGALFRLDRERGAVTLLHAPAAFVNPVDVLVIR